MQVVAGIVLPWVHNSGKASDELFHRAASALHRTQRFQPCPLRRNACLQAPAPYAIALGGDQAAIAMTCLSYGEQKPARAGSAFSDSVRDSHSGPAVIRCSPLVEG